MGGGEGGGGHWLAPTPPLLRVLGQRHPAGPLPLWKLKGQPGCLVAGTAAGWAGLQSRTAGCCAQGEKPDRPEAPPVRTAWR
jgi:hypothetical protein